MNGVCQEAPAPRAAAQGAGSTKPVVQALLSAAGFGLLGVLGRMAQQRGLPSSTALAWRFLVAASVVGAWLAQGRRPAFQVKPFALGALAYAAQAMLFFAAVERIGPGRAALLLYTYPAIVTVIGWLASRRRPSLGHVLALALTGAGSFLLLCSPGGGVLAPAGVLLGLGTAVVYSIYLLVSERLLAGIEPAACSFSVCLGTGVSLLVVSAAGGAPLVPVTAAQVLLIAGLAVLCTALPTILVFAAMRGIGSARAALCSTLELVVATGLGALCFGERYTPRQLAGALLIMGSIVAVFPALNERRKVTST